MSPSTRSGLRSGGRFPLSPNHLRVATSPGPSPNIVGFPLTFELIPNVMHRKCVRAVLPNDVWRLLRKITIEAGGGQCEECGTFRDLECHEVWHYLPPADTRRVSNRPVMKLAGLRSLCQLCHLGKHIGFALRCPQQYQQVKIHLMNLYRLPDSIYSQLEQLAYRDVDELNRQGIRALDLTYLNQDRYIWVRHRFGRSFTDDETSSCRQLTGVADLGA